VSFSARTIACGVFLLSSIGKLLSPQSANSLVTLISPVELDVGILVLLLALFELMVGIGLFWGILNATILAFLATLVVAGTVLLIGTSPFLQGAECGCFGGLISRRLGYGFVLGNLVLAVLLVLSRPLKTGEARRGVMVTGIMLGTLAVGFYSMTPKGMRLTGDLVAAVGADSSSDKLILPGQYELVRHAFAEGDKSTQLFVLFSPDCDACAKEVTLWQMLTRKIHSKRIQLTFLSLGKPRDTAVFLRSRGIENPFYALPETGRVLAEFGEIRIPAYLIGAANGARLFTNYSDLEDWLGWVN